MQLAPSILCNDHNTRAHICCIGIRNTLLSLHLGDTISSSFNNLETIGIAGADSSLLVGFVTPIEMCMLVIEYSKQQGRTNSRQKNSDERRGYIPINKNIQILLVEYLVTSRVLVHLAVLQEQGAQRLLVDCFITVELLAHRLKASFLDDELFQPALRVRAHEELLLDSALCGDAIHDDGARLPDTVAPVLGLQVLLWVPVASVECQSRSAHILFFGSTFVGDYIPVEYNNRIRAGEVDALSAGSGG